jgi:hypothetical protein
MHLFLNLILNTSVSPVSLLVGKNTDILFFQLVDSGESGV